MRYLAIVVGWNWGTFQQGFAERSARSRSVLGVLGKKVELTRKMKEEWTGEVL